MERKTLLQEVLDTLVARDGVSRSVADTFGHAFFEVIEEALRNDKFVKVKGFGTFKLVPVSERESVNVNTGKRIQIGSHSKITFTPDAYLRDLVNKPFSHFQTTILNDDTSLEELEAADELIPAEIETPETEADAPKTEKVDSVETSEKIETSEETAPEPPTYKVEDETVPDTPPAYHIDETQEQEETQAPVEEEKEQEQESGQQEEQEEQQTELPEETEEEKAELSTEETEEATAEETTGEETKNEVIEETTEDTAEEEKASPYPTRRIKWWKLLVALLFILLLMTASYFAGYFRVFCPPCETAATATKERSTTSQQSAAKPIPPVQPAATDTTKAAKGKAGPQPTTGQAKESTATDKDRDKSAQEAKPEKRTYNPAIHYEISGTRETYTVKAGEGVYRIAAKLYGNKKFARYIIKYNKLRDPDNIAVGAKLKIPELVEPTD